MKNILLIVIALIFIALSARADNIKLLQKSDSLFALGVELYNEGKFEEAIPIFTESDRIDKAVLDSTSNRREYSAMWLASCYYKLGDTQKAEETHQYYSFAPVDRRLTVKSDSLEKEGLLYLDNENFRDALNCFRQNAEIIKSVVGEKHIWYLISLTIIENLTYVVALIDASEHNYDNAIMLCNKSIEILGVLFGAEHEDYAIFKRLSLLCGCNYDIGNYAKALRLGERTIVTCKNVLGTENSEYATSLSNLAGYYAGLSNYAKAIQLGEEALSIRQRVLGTENSEYAASLSNIARYYAGLSNYDKAIKVGEEALIAIRKIGEENTLYARILSNMANFKFHLGKYNEAARTEKQALSIREHVLGNEHPDCLASFQALAVYLVYINDKKNAEYYNTKASETAACLIRKIFQDITAAERMMYWSKKFNDWYNSYTHALSYSISSNILTANGYNAALLSKGLLLNSEIEFSKLIQESGDPIAVDMYNDLKMRRLQINKLIEKPINERFANVDSLEIEAQKIEKALIDRSKVYGDYTKNLVITWPEVQQKLGNHDIAIEFVAFPLNADSTMYVAYTIRKNQDSPQMTVLFEEKQLLAVADKYTTDAVSRLVWQPLDNQLRDAENIYFSPSGELYNIAIESVPTHIDGGQTLVSEHNKRYYRLSSTRELALIKEPNSWREAAVYGGLQYNMNVAAMIQDDNKYERRTGLRRGDSTPEYYLVREDTTMRDDRGTIQALPYLNGTKIEAQAIKQNLDNKAVTAQLYTDNVGTETSFKDLSGRRKSIIHIGTHGFFNDRKKQYTDDHFLRLDNQPKVIEDDAMTRSGLYFAGADNVKRHIAIPDSIDDGKLTAMEIAQLDLRGLDLVVLSACQTGLGEITGDGVFGLQRGFKKAGAQTIVMSLWKVDDDATQLFMTQFFERLKLNANGIPTNKYEAFNEAQKYVRNYTDDSGQQPFAKPEYWAAFILLDGI